MFGNRDLGWGKIGENFWEPGFWVGGNRGKYWEPGFWVGESPFRVFKLLSVESTYLGDILGKRKQLLLALA